MQQPVAIFNRIVDRFLEECQVRNVDIDAISANIFLHLFARDRLEGLNTNKLSECKIGNFIERAIQRCSDPLDALINGIKLSLVFKNADELELEFVRKKYEKKFEKELQELIDGILQYPETSDKKQIEQMFVKMQVFIVANFNLGCPKDHVLLKQTRQSINSVIGQGDLQHYVLKKKYHRLEYLQRLSATVCGILIHSNHSPEGDSLRHLRDIIGDAKSGRRNTKENLESALKRTLKYKTLGMEVIEDLINISVPQRMVHCRRSIDVVREINKYVALFALYERYLNRLNEGFLKTDHLIEVAVGRYMCVIEKINEILKFRTAIDSEVIFPHFVFLSEVWSSLVLYLNHLTELNRIKDALEAHVCEKVEKRFLEIIDEICSGPEFKHGLHKKFTDLMEKIMQLECESDFMKIDQYHKNFCALTIGLTGGLLTPSTQERKICENLSSKFGFRDFEFMKYAESHFDVFLHCFRNAIYSSVESILLFNLEDEILREDFAEISVEEAPKNKSLETQTEMVVENDLSIPNQINVTWNVWDYHRETIRLADLRKRQTHSTQTVHSYGMRNAQNQMYNVRRHIRFRKD